MSRQDFHQRFFYECKLGRSATGTARNINVVWSEGSTTEFMVRGWFQRFRCGHMRLRDKERRDRSSKVDDHLLKGIIKDDPFSTTREIAHEIGVDFSMSPLRKSWKGEKVEQICSTLLLHNKSYLFFDRIVTCDEKWILCENRQRLAQWMDKHEASKHFPKQKMLSKKTMVTVWWCTTTTFHYSFMTSGETITTEKYRKELDEMHRKLQLLRLALVKRIGLVLLHGNARPHISKVTLLKLNELD